MSDAAQKADQTVQPAIQTGMGKVGRWGHPIHPATVHYPIGLLSISFGLDALQLAPLLTSGLTWLKVMPPAAVVNTLSHYTGAAGLLSAIPTVLSGLAELYGMWRGQAQSKGSAKTAGKDAAKKENVAGEKLKVTLTHAALNDAVLGIAAFNWWVRRQDKDLILPPLNACLSACALPLFVYSAYLGGSLVYEYGVGIMRQGEGAEIKDRQQKEQ